MENLRVDEHQQAVVVIPAELAVRDIHHADPEAHPDLRRGHPDGTGAIPHGVNEVGNKCR